MNKYISLTLITGSKIHIQESSIELVMEVNDKETVVGLTGHTHNHRVYLVKESHQSVLSMLGRYN